MTDNLGFFEEVVFKTPSLSKILPAYTTLGFVYSALFLLSASLFSPLPVEIYYIPLIAILGFILPGLIASELFSFFMEDFPRRWSYLLALANQFLFFIYTLILTGANNFTNAWSIFWIGLLTVFLVNMFVLLITQGYKKLAHISTLSLTQPLIIILFFHVVIGGRFQVSLLQYLTSFLVIVVGAAGFLAIIVIAEYFLRINLSGLSAVELTKGLIQKREKSLDLGYRSNPEVQALEIQNEDGKAKICIPWVHPGPVQGLGGGRLTSKIINYLNSSDTEGFFLHVPSTHKSDLANPEDIGKILDAMHPTENSEKSTKMIKKKYENVVFYGRKIGDQKIVFMDTEYDDYEVSIFKEVLDLEKALIVDMHCNDRFDREEEVWYGTEKAEDLRECLEDFLGELENQGEFYEYKAGFEVELSGRPVFAWVEDAGGQETLIFGVEGNGISDELQKLKNEMKEKYSEVIFFSTDTHRDIHEYAEGIQVDPQIAQETILSASEKVSKASAGFSLGKAEKIDLLKEDYPGLIYSINIMLRLAVFSLLLIYIGLVIWIFF